MSDQQDLFEHGSITLGEPPATARHTDPETSHEAAEKVNVTRGQTKVLSALLAHGARTTEELTDRIPDMTLVSISPTLRPMERKGWVEKLRDAKGELIKRKNRSGCNAIVWQLTKLGLDALCHE